MYITFSLLLSQHSMFADKYSTVEHDATQRCPTSAFQVPGMLSVHRTDGLLVKHMSRLVRVYIQVQIQRCQ